MSFIDFFKPRWKHSNPYERIEGIKSFYHMLDHDSQGESDEYFLSKVEVLAKIVENDINSDVQAVALNVLKRMALHKALKKTPLAAVKKLSDLPILNEIAAKAKNNNARKRAVLKITDQKILVDIAQNDEFSFVRESAVLKITDQKILNLIARNDNNSDVRKAAFGKLTDSKVKADITKNEKNLEKVSQRQKFYNTMSDYQLKCEKCGEIYSIGVDSYLMTDPKTSTTLKDEHNAVGMVDFIFQGNPDAVGKIGNVDSSAAKKYKSAFDAIDRNNGAWECHKCKKVNNYFNTIND